MTARTRLATLVALSLSVIPGLALAQVAAPAYPPPQPPPGSPPPPPPGSPPPQQQVAPPMQRPPPPNRLELTALAGYQLNTDAGTLRVDDTPVYGISLGFLARPGSRIQLLWLYSDPTAHASGSAALAGSSSFKVATHYFQLGGEQGIRRDKLEPFGGATIGAALFMPDSLRLSDGSKYSFDDTWRFGFTLGLGLKVHVSEKVLVRLEARLAAPVYFSGGGFYAGSGGSGVTVSGGVPIWQWNFLAGLGFAP